MPPNGFLRLEDLVLAPPLPSLLSPAICCAVAYLGWRLALGLRNGAPDGLDIAAGFVVAAALIAAVVHGLALAQLSTARLLRPFGWSLAAVGLYAVARHRARIASVARREARTVWAELSVVERTAAMLAAVTMIGLAASALGPPTDVDSLNYHLGVPLDWLRHGGAYARPDWFHARLVGLGESLNMLGLATGTDNLGAALQFSGWVIAVVAVRAFANTARDRVLALMLVVTCPVAAFLVPNQKPQMLPAAATTVALMLALRRFRHFGYVDAALSFGCLAFAASSKTSFLLSAGLVALTCLAAAHRSGSLTGAVTICLGAFVLLLGPVLVRNWVFFGDPLSPFLEPFRAHPSAPVLAFRAYLHAAGGERTLSNLAAMFVTGHPADFSGMLGLGALAFVPALRQGGVPHALLRVALLCAIAWIAFGQIRGRFLLEPYFWAGAALIGARASRGKELVFYGLTAQAALVAFVASFGAATLFPGALTAKARDAVMTRAAAGYAEGKWLDRVLPANAVMMGLSRSHALAPRPFVSADRILFDDAALKDERVLARMVTAERVNTVVSESWGDDVFVRLARLCGEPIGQPMQFAVGTRNPLNRVPHEARAFWLRECDGLAPPIRGASTPSKESRR